MVFLRLNHFLVEQISFKGYWKWDEITCLRYLGELDTFLQKHQDMFSVQNTIKYSTYDPPLLISYTLWMKFIHIEKTYTPPLSLEELIILWILFSSCCISENMGIFSCYNNSKIFNDSSQNIDPYQVFLDFRYFALFFFLQLRFCLKTSLPLFARFFSHHMSTGFYNMNSFEHSITGNSKQSKAMTHSFDSTYRPLVLTPRSKNVSSLNNSESLIKMSCHSSLSNNIKPFYGHENDTSVNLSCNKMETLHDFVMNKFHILLRIVHRHYLSDIHHVIPEHLNVLLLLMNPQINDQFGSSCNNLNTIENLLKVFSTRIPESEDVWSPVLVEQYLLRSLSYENEFQKNTNDLNHHHSEDCMIIVEEYQHETKVYYEQKSLQKVEHPMTNIKQNIQWNTLKSFRSFWLRNNVSCQIYIFHSRIKHVRIQNCSHACILIPAISGILLIMNCTHVEIMTTCRCLKIKDSSFIKISAFTWTSPIITGTCENILLGPYNVLFSKQKNYMKLNNLWRPSHSVMQWANPTKLNSHQNFKSLETHNILKSTKKPTESYQYVVNSMNVPCVIQTKSLKKHPVYSLISPDMFSPFVMPERDLLLNPQKLLKKYSLFLPKIYRLSLGDNQKKVQEQLKKIRHLCSDLQQMYKENVCNILHENFMKWLKRFGHINELFNISHFTSPGYFK